MSLASLNLAAAAAKGTVLKVLHFQTRTPLTTDAGAPVTITLLGRDAPKVVAKQRQQRNQAVEDARNGVSFDATAQDYRDAELLAAGTIGWSGVPKGWLIDLTPEKLEGMSEAEVKALDEPADFSEAAAVALYVNPGMSWLREQVVKCVDDRGKLLAQA